MAAGLGVSRVMVPPSRSGISRRQSVSAMVGERWQDLRRSFRSNRVPLCLGTLAAFLTWPEPERLSHTHFDYSWMYGLQQAAHWGIPFGPGIVWTYGPLGYLGNAVMFIPLYGVLSVIALGAVWLLLANTMTILATRSVGAIAVVPVTLILLLVAPLVTVTTNPLVLPLLTLWLVPRLLRDHRDWSPPAVVGFAFITVALFYVKATTGIEAIAVMAPAIVLGAALAGGIRAAARNAAWLLGGLVVAVPTLWVAAGQSVGNLHDWFSGYLAIADGYSSAMGTTSSGLAWQYPVALILVVFVVVCVAQTPNTSRATRGVLAIVVLLGLYAVFRASFTRQTGVEFFIALTIVPVAFAQRWAFSRWFALALASAVTLVMIGNLSVSTITDIPDHVTNVIDTAQLIASSSYRADWVKRQDAAFRRQYRLPPSIPQRVGRRTVDILPVDAALTFVYPSLRWDPLPVFQDYAAYTQELDNRNAVVLAGPHRPDDIIRAAPAAIDSRLQRFESPQENVELLCRYHLVFAKGEWQLLAAQKDRCGALTTASSIAAHFGAPVDVPASNTDIVVARLSGVGSSLGDKLQTTAIRGPKFYVSGDRGATWYRFLPGTQESWHIVSWPACAAHDLLNLGSTFSTLTMSNHSGPAMTHSAYQVQFGYIPYAC